MTVKFGKILLLNLTRTNADFRLEFWVIVLLNIHFSVPLILSFSLNQEEDVKCNS